MFELKIALKYLLPNFRSLSTALISLISVTVVALVVWLVLVFLSVTAGIEKTWVSKLTSLYGPIRISPTDAYYHSYYYQIDTYASASNHTLKTIGEKGSIAISDPYNESEDMELPLGMSKADLDAKGHLIDPVKTAIDVLNSLQKEFPGLKYQDYEISGALLKLELVRGAKVSYLTQMSYLLSMQEENPKFSALLMQPISTPLADDEVLLPKSYQNSGVVIGDKGFLAYSMPTSAISQEQRMPIRVAGFYDPGLLSIGNRCLVVPNAMTRQIFAASQTYCPDGTPTNGLFLWPNKPSELEAVTKAVADRFAKAKIDKYWNIATYEDYEFSKDLLQQFRSDRMLFSLIGAIILLVACCNIVSLLILLVNDKKREIGILQSMGATRTSIVSIFALCGTVTGLISCLIGGSLALFTLKHLNVLITFLSALQGRAALNPLFFGEHLAHELSPEATWFVLIATPILSLVAALIPALKASRIRPSAVLRSE